MEDYGKVDINKLIKRIDTVEVDMKELKLQLRTGEQTFGQHFKDVVYRTGITLEQFASMIELSKQSVYNYANDICIPNILSFQILQSHLLELDRRIWARAKARARNIKK